MSEVVDLFCSLAKIPSPSLGEDAVAEAIVSFCRDNGIKCRRDTFGNVRASVPATDKTKKPLMLSAHMDVVGDASPVTIVFSNDKIETDKKRTLGADDKTGVAIALTAAKRLAADKTFPHGGLEMTFTRDEESGMSGARSLDLSDVEAEHILVLDGETLGEFQVAGAGYTNLAVAVENTKGGHSGNDIADTTRVNAVKLLAEIMAEIPQGVFDRDETGVVTSINAGAVAGGGLRNKTYAEPFMKSAVSDGMTNMINTSAYAAYSIRSSDKASEMRLRDQIVGIVEKYKALYAGRATVSAVFSEKVPPFERAEDKTLETVARRAFENVGLPFKVTSFHAAAETHLYAHMTNKNGVAFKPVLIGAATIRDMHSANESVVASSIDGGLKLVEALIREYNR